MNKGLLGGTSEALASLKDGIKPKAGELLKSTKETLNNTASAVISGIAKIKEDFIKNPASRKEALGVASTAVLAYLLMPYLNKEKAKGKKAKESDKKDEPEQNQFVQTDTLAPIPAKATSTELVTAMFTNAKTLDELYKRYKDTKDPKEIRFFLTKAIIAKESGYQTPPEKAARFINVQAINPDNKSGRFLESKGIKFNMPGGSGALLPNETYLANFDAFKERVCSQLQPNIPEPKRTDNTAEILIRSAIGMGQILPIYHIDGINELSGNDKLRKIYDFIKSGREEEKVTERIVDNLGKKYEWNPACIAAAYYGGERAGDMVKNAPQSESLDKTQAYGYGSIRTYVERVSSMTQKIIKDQKAS